MTDTMRGTQLRALLSSPELACLVEAHNALSARIVADAGLEGIWASSLTLSAAHGLPDNGTLTMTQALEVLESMTERTALPVLFDGDHGYGDLHQFQRLVRKLELRQVAGVCIEDKCFPKQNSFLRSESQPLSDVAEFCAKLRAGKDAQGDGSFVIVARTEALVTGLSVSAALDRAESYAEAGADAVLVHSKAPTFAEVQAFMRQWSGRVPVICVPTSYYSTTPEAFESAGVAMIIWANHLLRASIVAMQRAAREVRATRSARTLEDDIAPLSEVFRLQDVADLERTERLYASQGSGIRAVVLAASRGDGLDALTEDRPKAMISVGGEPVIERLLRQLRSEGVREIALVRGYRADALSPSGVRFFDNRRWMETGEVGSLGCALSYLEGDVIIAYGDLVLRQHLLHELISAEAPITLLVDGRSQRLAERPAPSVRDRVRATRPEPALGDEQPVTLVEIGPEVSAQTCHGQWMGLLRVRGPGIARFKHALERVLARPQGEREELSAVLNDLVRDEPGAVRVLYVQGDWMDINSLLDVARSVGSP